MTERNAQQTRQKILEVGFEEMYERGFQGMRVDEILEKAQLTKGAFYHHFENKKSLAYAIIDELLLEHAKNNIGDLNNEDTHPIDVLCERLKQACEEVSEQGIGLGCPINNIAQEMSGLDEGFKERLNQVYDFWAQSISQALQRGKDKNQVKPSVNPEYVSMFIISAFEGITGTAKCLQSKEAFCKMLDVLRDYLNTLRT